MRLSVRVVRLSVVLLSMFMLVAIDAQQKVDCNGSSTAGFANKLSLIRGNAILENCHVIQSDINSYFTKIAHINFLQCSFQDARLPSDFLMKASSWLTLRIVSSNLQVIESGALNKMPNHFNRTNTIELAHNTQLRLTEGMFFPYTLASSITIINCKPTSSLPTGFFKGITMNQLKLDDFGLAAVPNDALQLLAPKLSSLSLQGHVFNVLNFSVNFLKLRVLNLRNSSIEDVQSNAFELMPLLESLTLDTNKIVYLPWNLFSANRMLKTVSLVGNQIVLIDPSVFAWEKLNYLNLSMNPLQCSCDMYLSFSRVNNSAHVFRDLQCASPGNSVRQKVMQAGYYLCYPNTTTSSRTTVARHSIRSTSTTKKTTTFRYTHTSPTKSTITKRSTTTPTTTSTTTRPTTTTPTTTSTTTRSTTTPTTTSTTTRPTTNTPTTTSTTTRSTTTTPTTTKSTTWSTTTPTTTSSTTWFTTTTPTTSSSTMKSSTTTTTLPTTQQTKRRRQSASDNLVITTSLPADGMRTANRGSTDRAFEKNGRSMVVNTRLAEKYKDKDKDSQSVEELATANGVFQNMKNVLLIVVFSVSGLIGLTLVLIIVLCVLRRSRKRSPKPERRPRKEPLAPATNTTGNITPRNNLGVPSKQYEFDM